MLWTLLSAALAHAPVPETLASLDLSVEAEARRAAHLRLHQGEAEEALKVLHPSDGTVEAELLRAEAELGLRRTEAARVRLDGLLTTPQLSERARAFDLRAALQTDPTAAWNDRAQAVLLEPTPDRALAAAAAAPHPSAALPLLAHSRAVLGSSVSLDQTLARTWLALDAPEAALELLEGATGASTQGRLLQALAHEQAGRPTEAHALRTELLAELDRRLASRDSPLLHLARARCLLALDRTADARAVLQQVVRVAPDLASARALLDSLEPA